MTLILYSLLGCGLAEQGCDVHLTQCRLSPYIALYTSRKNIGKLRLATYGYEYLKKGIYWIFLFMYVIQQCFICHPSGFTVSEDAEIEPLS
jgi:hypothetical protein